MSLALWGTACTPAGSSERPPERPPASTDTSAGWTADTGSGDTPPALKVVWADNAEPFEPTDDRVGGPMFDPEFEGSTAQFTWLDSKTHEVWVGAVDPVSGELIPFDGRGELVGDRMVSEEILRNGPEWMLGPHGAEVLYSQVRDGVPVLGHAFKEQGVWTYEAFEGTGGQIVGLGSLDLGAQDPRFIFADFPGDAMRWRNLSGTEGASLGTLDIYSAPRFVSGTELLCWSALTGGIPQVFLHDLEHGTKEQLTFGDTKWADAQVWVAPELGGVLMLQALRFDAQDNAVAIDVFRAYDGVWTPILEIMPPARLPHLTSPEVLVVKGHSYITFVAGDGPWPEDSEVWLASATPEGQVLRRLSEDSVASRRDPESIVIGDSAFVYYTLHGGGTPFVHRVRTGL